MVSTRQGVLTAASAAVAAAAVDASVDVVYVSVTTADACATAAAGVAREAVKSTAAADTARGTVKRTANDDDDADDLCLPRALPSPSPPPPPPPRAPLPHPWPLPRGFTHVARVWVPPALPSLVLESSIRARASPNSPGSMSAITKTFYFQHRKWREGHSGFDD